MKALVVNCGSSYLKYQLSGIENVNGIENATVLAKGLAERISMEGSKLKHQITGKEKEVIHQPMKNHKVALEIVLKLLLDVNTGVIKSLDEIGAIGHRYVNINKKYSKPVKINTEISDGLRPCIDYTPLHNSIHIMGIKVCQELIPNAPNIVVSDTDLHSTTIYMPFRLNCSKNMVLADMVHMIIHTNMLPIE